MLPIIDIESLILAESFECFILDGFLKRSEFEASLGDNCTVILDRMHDLAESVELGYILSGNDNALVFVDNNGLTCGCIEDHSVVLASEEDVQLGEIVNKLLKRRGKGREDEVGGRTPVEVL